MIECHWRMCADCANNSRLEWSHYEQKWKLKEQCKCKNEWKNANKDIPGYQYYKEQPKMTREEAIELAKKLGNSKPYYESDIALLEALGLLKFDEPLHMIFEYTQTGRRFGGAPKTPQELELFNNKYGVVRLEEWPEGLVLWVGGEIKWKSWVDYYKAGDAATIDYYDGLRHEKQKQAGIIS